MGRKPKTTYVKSLAEYIEEVENVCKQWNSWWVAEDSLMVSRSARG